MVAPGVYAISLARLNDQNYITVGKVQRRRRAHCVIKTDLIEVDAFGSEFVPQRAEDTATLVLVEIYSNCENPREVLGSKAQEAKEKWNAVDIIGDEYMTPNVGYREQRCEGCGFNEDGQCLVYDNVTINVDRCTYAIPEGNPGSVGPDGDMEPLTSGVRLPLSTRTRLAGISVGGLNVTANSISEDMTPEETNIVCGFPCTQRLERILRRIDEGEQSMIPFSIIIGSDRRDYEFYECPACGKLHIIRNQGEADGNNIQ